MAMPDPNPTDEERDPSNILLSTVPRPSPCVHFAEVAGHRTFLIRADSGEIFGFDEIGTFIWNQIGRSASLQEIVTSIVERFDVTAEVAQVDVLSFLSDLKEQGLLAES